MGNPENREYCVLFMQFVIFIYLYRDENKTTVSSRVIASSIKLWSTPFRPDPLLKYFSSILPLLGHPTPFIC